MDLTYSGISKPTNEPVFSYPKGSEEREKLNQAIKKFTQQREPKILFPIIDGKEVTTRNLAETRRPGDWSSVLAKYHLCSENHLKMAIDSALRAKKTWSSLSPFERAQIFWRAGEVMRKRRYELVAGAMLEVDKIAFEADGDLAELIDFFDFNPYWALTKIYPEQPDSVKGETNTCVWRPLKGFIAAITPWNFPLAIGGNLPTSPAIMGNVVVWKPSSDSVLTASLIMDCLLEAGLPPGVINLVFGRGSVMGKSLIGDERLGGVHFTGSLEIGRWLAEKVGANTSRGFPRIVVECGGKDFIFAHESCDLEALAWGIVAGGYSYQGQKCSAASRIYVPQKIWQKLKKLLVERLSKLKVGDVTDPEVGMGAVINKASWESIKGYIDKAIGDPDCEIVFGGKCWNEPGWFVEPTLILTKNPRHKLMTEEIFGPVVTVYLFDEKDYDKALSEVVESTNYALTGSLYSEDLSFTNKAIPILIHSAGNLYINDKPTGAIVSRQWFGGDGNSGTNNKAGSFLNLLVWASPSVIKWASYPRRE